MARLTRIALGVIVPMVLLLYLIQDKLIYHPRPYPAAMVIPAEIEALPYATAQGQQLAFYRGPAAPERMWVVFGGNASLALEWYHLIAEAKDPSAGFLLIDYPGYGTCGGKPSPSTMRANADGALAALAERQGRPLADLERHLRVLGHSLGAGVALDFARGHPCERAVLVAPFTSLRDMAWRTVGWPLNWLLKANLDNRARIRELLARESPPGIVIYHGDADEVIPVAMGRELARLFPAIVYHEARGSTHNRINDDQRPALLAEISLPDTAVHGP